MHERTGLILLIVLMGAAPSLGQGQGIHIAGESTTNFPWTVTDGEGFRWDIYSNGNISNGTNNAYSGACILYVNNSSFSWSSPGKLSKDGREIEVGPWQHGALRVWRRIYVPRKEAYARWIDIFQNTSDAKTDVRVRYQFSLGNSMQLIQSTQGAQQMGEGDWAFLSDDSQGSSRPPLCHVFAARGAKVLPRVEAQVGNSTFYYNFELSVPPRQTVALCLIESQRRGIAEAQAMLKKFRPAGALQSAPVELRSLVLNMKGTLLLMGNLELPREADRDLAVLRNGNELPGTILETKFSVETFYGRMDLPAERVVGLCTAPDDAAYVRVALTDGQIVAGRLLTAPVRIKLESGGEMALQVDRIATVSYRVSPQRPESVTISRPTLATRCGQQVYFKAADVDCTFLTEYGRLKLLCDDLLAIHLDTPGGGLHRAVFWNGSVLSGLLVANDLKLSLDLGPTLSLPASSVASLAFPRGEPTVQGLAEVKLRNDDVLYGRFRDKVLTVNTRFGPMTVAASDVKSLRLGEEALNRLELELHNGTRITGQATGDTIPFKVEPGPEVPLFIGHVVEINCPGPEGSAADTQPADANGPSAARPRRDLPKEMSDDAKRALAEIEEVRQRLEAIDQQSLKAQKAAKEMAASGRAEEATRLRQQADALQAEARAARAHQAALEAKLAAVSGG